MILLRLNLVFGLANIESGLGSGNVISDYVDAVADWTWDVGLSLQIFTVMIAVAASIPFIPSVENPA